VSEPGFPVLRADDVARLSNELDVASALREAFAGLASGRSHQPPQTVVEFDDGADAIVYLAAIEDLGVISVKVSPYLPARKPPVTAWTLLLSTETGEPVLLCDSAAPTAERTAGTTALAVDYLAPAVAPVLAVVGSGPLAAAHLRHVTPLRRFAEVRVFSPSAARGDNESRARMSAAAAVDFEATVEAAVAGADVVLLCTSSGDPVLETAATEPRALITSISTNKPQAHEIPPRELAELAVYCDYRATAPLAAGEMVSAAEEGIWSASEIIADLPELVSGAAPSRPDGRAYFRSTGLGIEDAAVAVALLRASEARN
jgi:L-arginine dehydrogenase